MVLSEGRSLDEFCMSSAELSPVTKHESPESATELLLPLPVPLGCRHALGVHGAGVTRCEYADF